MKYHVINKYGIHGESTHKTAQAALKATDKREGAGWIVRDDQGRQWTRGANREPVRVD